MRFQDRGFDFQTAARQCFSPELEFAQVTVYQPKLRVFGSVDPRAMDRTSDQAAAVRESAEHLQPTHLSPESIEVFLKRQWRDQILPFVPLPEPGSRSEWHHLLRLSRAGPRLILCQRKRRPQVYRQ